MTEALYILAVLASAIALSEVLVRRTVLRHLGTALLVIVIVAVAVNVGLIPAVSAERPVPLYDGLLGPVAKLAIFWLLLRVDLAALRRAGGKLVSLFLIGSAGTFAGVLVAMQWVDMQAFEPHVPGIGAMFVGTYTGGSVNFNAMAVAHGVTADHALFPAAAAVDSLMTTVWMAVTLTLPRLLARRPADARGESVAATRATAVGGPEVDGDRETVEVGDVALLLALGAAAVWGSEALARSLAPEGAGGAADGMAILILTTLALVAANLPGVRSLGGTRLLGMVGVYLFLAAIGALCDLSALAAVGDLGWTLLRMVAIALTVHGLVVAVGARLLGAGSELAAVASQANVGGATSALALARSLGRGDLVLPAILVGALGTALGNYLGLATGVLLR